MTVRRGKPAKGPAGLYLMAEERDRLPERILKKYDRFARLFILFGGWGCT